MKRNVWSNVMVLATTVVLAIFIVLVLTVNGIGFRPFF
jgi:hypothetical protein